MCPAILSGLIDLIFSAIKSNASSHSALTNFPSFFIYGLSIRCFKRPSQAYLLLSDIHSSLISLFNLGNILFTSQP